MCRLLSALLDRFADGLDHLGSFRHFVLQSLDSTGSRRYRAHVKRARCDAPDGCGKLFRIKLEDRPRDDGGVDRVFTCPKCGHVYPVATISARGVELMRRMSSMRDKGQTVSEKMQAEMEREVSAP